LTPPKKWTEAFDDQQNRIDHVRDALHFAAESFGQLLFEQNFFCLARVGLKPLFYRGIKD
jgi:hypothetical protein